MRRQLNNLIDFQRTFKSTYSDTPVLLSPEEYKLRYELLLEELNEYKEACENGDLKEILDSNIDILFLVLGNIVSHGLQDLAEDAFQEIFVSNMSKLDENREPIINGENGVYDPTRPLGKLLKSKNYFPPNLEKIFENYKWK